MKIKFFLLTLVCFLSEFSLEAREGKQDLEHPCKTLKQACEAAGFTKANKDGKRLFADCINKIAKGESVPGVSVSAEEIKRCTDQHRGH